MHSLAHGCLCVYDILSVFIVKLSRDGSVSIVIGYGLDDRGSVPDGRIITLFAAACVKGWYTSPFHFYIFYESSHLPHTIQILLFLRGAVVVLSANVKLNFKIWKHEF